MSKSSKDSTGRMKKCFGLECGNWHYETKEGDKLKVVGREKQLECSSCHLFDQCAKVTQVSRQSMMIDLLLVVSDGMMQLASRGEAEEIEEDSPEKFNEEVFKKDIERAEMLRLKKEALKFRENS